MSPNGVLDNVLDQNGNKYRLIDLLVNRNSNNNGSALNRSPLINCTSTSYFNLFFEAGSGMEIVVDPVQNNINAARRATVCQVFQDLSAFINSPLTTTGNKVNIWIRNINALQLPSTNGLLGVGSGFYNLPSSTTTSGIADNEVWKTIHSGVDSYANVAAPLVTTGTSSNASGLFYHGYLALNFNTNNNPAIVWNTNTTTTNVANRYDLYSVVLHEMMHVLGFNTLINENGLSRFNSANYKYFARYDQFLKSNSNVNLLRNAVNSTLFGNEYNLNNIGVNVVRPNCGIIGNVNTGPSLDNTVCGAEIKFAGTTNTVPVYTPACYENGSSLSHFEDQHYPTCNSTLYGGNNNYFLMCNAGGTGVTRRYLKPEERNALCDIGYNINNVYGVSGAKINGTSNSFNYGGTATCSGITVAGTNDGFNPNSTYSFVAQLNTNLTISKTTLLLNDKNATNIESIEDVTSFAPIVPAIANSNITTSGNDINFNSGNAGLHLLRYVPTATINGVLQRGNITYVYVFVRDVIIACPAIPNTCDLIINGDFEQNVNRPIGSNSENLNLNCGWQEFAGTPDRYRTVESYNSLQIPCNFHGNQFDATTNVGNRSYIGIGNVSRNNGQFKWHELVKTKLKAPLIAGETYQLSFNSSLGDNWSGSSVRLQACVSANDRVETPESADFDLLNDTILTATYFSSNTATWDTNVITFTAVGGEQYLYLGNLRFDNPYTNLTFNNQFPNCGLSNPGNIDNDTFVSYQYIDNVSLIPVNGTFNLPLTITCANINPIDNLALLINGVPLNGSFSGLGVTMSGQGIYSFNPVLSGTGNIAVTYTYTSGGCPKSLIRNINVSTASVLPTFNVIPTICRGSSFALPLVSNNGISGTWSPAFDNQNTTTYTFTPNANSCGIATTRTVTISPTLAATPLFNPIPAICYGANLTLPITSINGISGTWSPAINNTQTTTYTFTPSFGTCVSTTTLTVVVQPSTITISGNLTACIGTANVYTCNVAGGTWSFSNTAVGTINATGKFDGIATGSGTITYTVTTGSCTLTATLAVQVFNPNIIPTFNFPTTICKNSVAPFLPNTSLNGIPGNWIPSVIDNTASANYIYKPLNNNCSPTFNVTVTVINTGNLIANDDTFNIPFSSSSQTSPNILFNDTFNGTLLTSNFLGLTTFFSSTPTYGITANANGTLNIPANLAVGTYIVKFVLRKNCIISNAAAIIINIFPVPANNIITAPKRFSIHELCYKPYAYTTTQSIFTDVTIGGVPASAGSVSISNVVAPVGFSLNANGTVNIPAGALPETNFELTLTLCPIGSTVGCVVNVPLYINISTTLRPNVDVYSCGTSGNFLFDSFDPIFRNVITNDQYSNNCGLPAPNSFGQAILGTNVTFQSGAFVPPNPYFTINSSGLVNRISPGTVIAGVYNFNYTICDKNYPTVCKNGIGWVSVLSGARPSKNIINNFKNNVKNDFDLEKIIVYPNPSDGIFNISFQRKIDYDLNLTVTNLIGQILFEKKLFEVSNFELDLSNYSSGTYLMKIANENISVNSKLIIK